MFKPLVEEKEMKRMFSVFLAMAFAFSMVGFAFAAEKAEKAAEVPKAEAPAAAPGPMEKK